MSYVFQVSPGKDYETAEAAIAAVEQAGSGTVVKFLCEDNLPNCLPKRVYRSLAMWSLQHGCWYAYSIFSATAEKFAQEKPR